MQILKSLASPIAKILYWEALLAQVHAHFFVWCDFMMGVGKPNCVPNVKSIASAIQEILKGNSQILGSYPIPGYFPSGCDFTTGLRKPQLCANLQTYRCYTLVKLVQARSVFSPLCSQTRASMHCSPLVF